MPVIVRRALGALLFDRQIGDPALEFLPQIRAPDQERGEGLGIGCDLPCIPPKGVISVLEVFNLGLRPGMGMLDKQEVRRHPGGDERCLGQGGPEGDGVGGID